MGELPHPTASKVGNCSKTEYFYNGSILAGQKTGNDIIVFMYDNNSDAFGFIYNSTEYYYIKNAQNDVTAIADSNGNVLARYYYDAWGKVLEITGNTEIAGLNPIRYRSYYYDAETGWYYLNTRYYSADMCRFINSDDESLTTSSPAAFTDKNLFTYCDNNSIVRIDSSGDFWETAFDVVSLGASIVEVCVNPTDPWAWAGLVGDTIDLVPFVSGVGEVTRAVKTTVEIVDKTEDVVGAAKKLYKAADATSDIRKATGSYEILYKSGKNYIGKGGFKRAIRSATRNTINTTDKVTSIRWKSAPNSRAAFIDEYLMQKRFGGVLKSNKRLKTYNKIWSPGRRYFGG